jgi:hypothetical protein
MDKNLEKIDYILDDVESCEQIGEFEDVYVYDIEVDDETHTFIGNDILVHNSLYLTYQPILKSVGYEGDELEFIHSMDRLFVKNRFVEWLDKYAEKYNVKNIHDFELEAVNKSSLHIEKKNYINNTVWEDGIYFNDMEHFVPKGVEIVKSSTPPFSRGKKQKGGVWTVIDYLFRNANNLQEVEVLKIVKKLKEEFKMAPIEDISFTSTLSNYDDRILDDQSGVECMKGAHFSVKAAATHNFLLNKHGKYKSKYDLLKGGRIKWYFIKNCELNDRFAFARSFHPQEIIDAEKIEIDYDRNFELSFLKIINRFIEPIGLPTINKRLGVLNSLFDGKQIGDVIKENRDNGNLDEIDEWDDEFDF